MWRHAESYAVSSIEILELWYSWIYVIALNFKAAHYLLSFFNVYFFK